MKRLFVSFVVMSFVLWVLPLGYFIKPSQQKMACDGQRALCMCHVMLPKSIDKPMEAATGLKWAGSSTKENSSGSGANSFVLSNSALLLNHPSLGFIENQHLFYNNPFLPSAESVPKGLI